MSSPKRLARIAGILYLAVAVFSGFAFGYVLTKVYVPGDATATAANVLANSGLVRLGVVADLVQATVTVILGMTLYRLLKHVSQNAASAMVVLIAIASAIMCLNDVFQFAASLVATAPAYGTAFGAAGANALVLLLLDMQHYGFLIAQIFFGLWLVPMGYLAFKSAMFPKVLGVMLVGGGRLLSSGHARAVPGPRLGPTGPRFPGDPAHARGGLDGPILAHRGSEGPRSGHPHRERRKSGLGGGGNSFRHVHTCCEGTICRGGTIVFL